MAKTKTTARLVAVASTPSKAATPVKAATTPLKKKSNFAPIKNPYSSPSKTGSPKRSKFMNFIDAAGTLVDDIIICTAIKYNGDQAFLYDLKNALADDKGEEGWNIISFMSHRDPSKPGANEYLFQDESDFPWDCIVCRRLPDDDAVSVGAHIAQVFTDFNVHQHMQKTTSYKSAKVYPAAKFEFRNDLTVNPAKPLNYYLTDGDTLKLLKHFYSEDNTMSTVVNNDDILKDFFGSAHHGRDIIELLMSNDEWDQQEPSSGAKNEEA